MHIYVVNSSVSTKSLSSIIFPHSFLTWVSKVPENTGLSVLQTSNNSHFPIGLALQTPLAVGYSVYITRKKTPVINKGTLLQSELPLLYDYNYYIILYHVPAYFCNGVFSVINGIFTY